MGLDTATTTVGLVSGLAAKPQGYRSSTGVDSDSAAPVAAVIVSHDVSSPRTVDLTPNDSGMLLHPPPSSSWMLIDTHIRQAVARAFVRSNLIHKCFVSRDVYIL